MTLSSISRLYTYHDWILYGIEADNDSDVVFSVRQDSNKGKIYFKNVEILQVDLFTIGNIIFSIDLYHDKAAITKLSERINSGIIDNKYIAVPALVTLERQVTEDGYIFVSLTPTYGCVASIFCESIIEAAE